MADDGGFDGRTLGPYELGKTLGQGAQGKVKLALDGRGRQHALKIIKLEDISTERTRSNLANEIEALGKVHHPNVLALLDGPHEGDYPRRNGATRRVLYFSTEVCPTELFNVLMHTGPFSDVVARAYSQQLLSALAACKAQGICHRDIKPENLMIDDQYRLKVVDFGLAHIFPHERPMEGREANMFDFEPHADMCRTRVGTPQYMAPSVIERREYRGHAADMWSTGCIMFIMLSGFPPFSEAKGTDWWFQRVLEGDFDSFWAAHERQARFSDGAKDLLQQMFEPSDDHRITVEQALQHHWLREQADDISQDALAAELRRRIRVVTTEQEEERRRNPPRGSSVDAHTPVTRGPGGGAAAQARDGAEPLSAPVLKRAEGGGFVDGRGFVHNQLIAYYTRKSARETLDRLHQALDMINAKHSMNEGAVMVKGKIVVPSASISFTLSVFDIGDGLHLIEVNRIKGPSLKFHEVYAKIGEKLDDILVTPPDLAGAEEEEAKFEASAAARHK